MQAEQLANLALRVQTDHPNANAYVVDIIQRHHDGDVAEAEKRYLRLVAALDQLDAARAEKAAEEQRAIQEKVDEEIDRLEQIAEAAKANQAIEEEALARAAKAKAETILSMRWGGEWQSGEEYDTGTVVSSAGAVYIAVEPTREKPRFLGPGWAQIAVPPGSGAPGSSGAPGAPGSPGPPGPPATPIYISGDFPVMSDEFDDDPQDGHTATTRDTATGRTLLWTRSDGIWYAAEVVIPVVAIYFSAGTQTMDVAEDGDPATYTLGDILVPDGTVGVTVGVDLTVDTFYGASVFSLVINAYNGVTLIGSSTPVTTTDGSYDGSFEATLVLPDGTTQVEAVFELDNGGTLSFTDVTVLNGINS